MSLKRHNVIYNLDSGQEIRIVLQYDDSTSNQRLSEGGLTSSGASCIGAITKRGLKPREVTHKQLGRIIFKTHQAWVNYIQSNKQNITMAKGEVLNCLAVQSF